ncbi:MAG: hypothetical protein KA408_11045 [Flavobacteriales bacterium]|nr:hypothetical protein [Flavobacteriales bacterium]
MKTLTYIAAVALLAFPAACKDKEKVVETVVVADTTTVEDTPAMPVAEELVAGMESSMDHPIPDSHKMGGGEKEDSLVFSIGRTPCFGTCKAYWINVYRSGYATFNGNSNVEKIGPHEGWVGQDTIVMLINEAYRIGFFELEDIYDGPVTDLPSMTIQVVANDKDKKVTGRVGTPTKLKNFGKLADELLFPIAWIPIAPKD